MELKCELSTKANPQAEITWTRCDCDNCSRCKELELLENTTSVTNSEILSSLAIQKQTSETAIYRCKAKNLVGSDERKWTVIKGRLNYSSLYNCLDWACIVSKVQNSVILSAAIFVTRVHFSRAGRPPHVHWREEPIGAHRYPVYKQNKMQ